MAWTTPRTWVAGELVTAIMMNTHVRDNLNAMRDYLLGAQDLGANWEISNARFLYGQAPGVSHGMTSVVPTDVYYRLGVLSSTDGGLNLNGFSDTDAVGLNCSGVSGSTAPTIPPLIMNFFKKSGTAVASVAAAEKGFRITNGGTSVFEIYGDGTQDLFGAPHVYFDKVNNYGIHYVVGTPSIQIACGGNSTTISAAGLVTVGAVRMSGACAPSADNSVSCGTGIFRWSEVFAAIGAINTSDRRVKTNIAPLRYGLAEVLRLRPVSFDRTDVEGGMHAIGFIAQEVDEVVEEAVRRPTEVGELYGLRADALVPVLVRAIQELSERIDNKERKLA